MPGKSGSSGMTIVCCSATTVPHSDRIPTTAQVGAGGGHAANWGHRDHRSAAGPARSAGSERHRSIDPQSPHCRRGRGRQQ